jgi:hypothetical protein
MREQLIAYFTAEKWGAGILVVVGVAALTTAMSLAVTKSSYRAMAGPLGFIAIAELAIGAALLIRTDAQVAGLLEQMTTAPADMARGELARMATVMRTFTMAFTGEIVVIVIGLGLAYMAGRRDAMFAVGVGLFAQASVLLVFDLFAARRAAQYVELVRGLGS